MEHAFWHEKWQQNQIGFHRDDINSHLEKQWAKLAVEPGGLVFVPLCGKTNDMLWLLEQGYRVIGVELSQLAVEAFFAENNLKPTTRRQGQFLLSEIDELQICCGDFFALSAETLPQPDAVYDRAALVALPQLMRTDYALKMSTLLKPAAKILLVAFDYLQDEMSGPPFSVPQQEVEKLYQNWCRVELLLSENRLEQEPHLKSRGLTQLQEQVYQLTVK
jgi:thiopurine S-methyltransferase